MQHYYSLEEVNLQAVNYKAAAWLTIGSFDGVHLGHQAIVRRLAAGAHAENAPAVVLTFHPHPAKVLRNRQGPFYLTTPEERADLLGEMGVDMVITHPFNHDVAGLSAREFISRLHNSLGMGHLCIGHDFALGRGREGNFELLQQLGTEFGYTVESFSPVELDEQVISSSRIRSALAEGDVVLAGRLLGRSYQARGAVIHGDGRGRTIGIPTANLELWNERLIPKPGVYACLAQVDGAAWQAVTNIGYRPTFDGQTVEIHVETHLLDFKHDLYGHEVALSFVERLRDEQRFSGVTELVEQIHRDIVRAREILPVSRNSISAA
jgi:riboflavin kinase / FMN adenylyltransferase